MRATSVLDSVILATISRVKTENSTKSFFCFNRSQRYFCQTAFSRTARVRFSDGISSLRRPTRPFPVVRRTNFVRPEFPNVHFCFVFFVSFGNPRWRGLLASRKNVRAVCAVNPSTPQPKRHRGTAIGACRRRKATPGRETLRTIPTGKTGDESDRRDHRSPTTINARSTRGVRRRRSRRGDGRSRDNGGAVEPAGEKNRKNQNAIVRYASLSFLRARILSTLRRRRSDVVVVVRDVGATVRSGFTGWIKTERKKKTEKCLSEISGRRTRVIPRSGYAVVGV